MDKATLKKYELGGVFQKQGVHSFFLINMEATLYLFSTSVIVYMILTLIVKIYTLTKGKKLQEKDLGIVMKQVIQKQEDFEWNGFPRQLMIYTIQAVLFSLLQFKNVHYDTWIESLSSSSSILVMVVLPSFLFWLAKAKVFPNQNQFVVKVEPRKIFESFKTGKSLFALMTPFRKCFMSCVIVIFNTSPTMQISMLLLFSMV